MNRRLFLATVAMSLALPVAALAQHEHGGQGAPASTGNAQASDLSGQVTRVDARASKITIKHGPIKEFGLEDGHTMVFRAQQPDMVKAVKAGDKVKFDAERVNGEYILNKIQKT